MLPFRMGQLSFFVRLALCESQAVDIANRAYRDGNTPPQPSKLSKEDDGSDATLLYRSELWLNRLYGGIGEVRIGFARQTNTLTIDGKDTGKRQLIIGNGK